MVPESKSHATACPSSPSCSSLKHGLSVKVIIPPSMHLAAAIHFALISPRYCHCHISHKIRLKKICSSFNGLIYPFSNRGIKTTQITSYQSTMIFHWVIKWNEIMQLSGHYARRIEKKLSS